MDWPNHKKFAFTIIDDTDSATTANVAPVYELLAKLGIRITKTVWPLRSDPDTPDAGDSLEDPRYREFILGLQANGFEIGYHGTRSGSSARPAIAAGLDYFRDVLGHDPKVYAQHARLMENVYWGPERTSMPGLRQLAAWRSQHRRFSGDDPQSPHFWGDLCLQRIEYVRNYGVSWDRLLESDPWMPYHDPTKPYVKHWFSTNTLLVRPGCLDNHLTEDRLRSWEETGECVLLMTHFGQGFVRDGRVDAALETAMRRLADSDGWLAPAGPILDHVRSHRGVHALNPSEARRLELRWAMQMGRKVIKDKTARLLHAEPQEVA